MDAFKLLTRSTKLTKTTSHVRDNPLGLVPSAGQTISPQLFGRRNDESQSRKRKRGDLLSKSSGDLPLELDFFNQSINPRDQHSSQNGTDTQYPGEASTGDMSGKNHKSLLEGSPSMNEEECKRYLKMHKIRVTRLATSIQDRPKSSKDKGKKRPSSNSDNQKQRKRFEELFPQPLLSLERLRQDYGVSMRLAENILEQGYRTPTEVQMGSLPLLLRKGQEVVATGDMLCSGETSGDNLGAADVDLIAVAPTGSGKTLAFLIPVLEGLLRKKYGSSTSREKENEAGAQAQGPKALIVVPTKELLAQIVNEGRKVASGTGIKVTGMRKGMRVIDHSDVTRTDHLASTYSPDTSRDQGTLSRDGDHGDHGTVVKAQILVTTPLSFLNAIKMKNGSASQIPSVEYLVLDEADVLLDPLFRDQTLEIWDACSNPTLRISLWSATMGSSIEELAMSKIQSRRERLGGDPSKTWQLLRVVIGIKDSAVPNIDHRLIYAATEAGKLLALRQLMHPSKAISGPTPPLRPPFLVFTQTIPRAIALHSELLYDIPLEAGGSDRIAVLHSDLSDTARDRVMTGFRKGEIWVLITTDILSRGVDFRGVNGVVNYDVPNSAAAYIHRGGRTGRAGREGGVAVTLYTKEDIPYIKSVANVIAATERLRCSSGMGEPGLQKWLLDALPKPSKAEKKRLKRHGVSARNAPLTRSGDDKAKEHLRMRISTKSGYDRRLEHNRKGAILGSRRRPTSTRANDEDLDEDVNASDPSSEWDGIQD